MRRPGGIHDRHCLQSRLCHATIFAAAAAVALPWLFLRDRHYDERPATARRIPVRKEWREGTTQLTATFRFATLKSRAITAQALAVRET